MSETGSLHGVLAIVVPSFTRLTCMAGTDACSKLTVSEAFGPILCNFDGFDENRPVLTLSPNASLAGKGDGNPAGTQCLPCRLGISNNATTTASPTLRWTDGGNHDGQSDFKVDGRTLTFSITEQKVAEFKKTGGLPG